MTEWKSLEESSPEDRFHRYLERIQFVQMALWAHSQAIHYAPEQMKLPLFCPDEFSREGALILCEVNRELFEMSDTIDWKNNPPNRQSEKGGNLLPFNKRRGT